MTFERHEYESLKKVALQDQAARITPQLHLLKQGAVVGEMMTGAPQWDQFLQYLQGAIETTREQLVGLVEALTSPDTLDPARIMQVKVSVLRCKERIAAWQAVMLLPKELIERGEQAQALLTRMEKIDADS